MKTFNFFKRFCGAALVLVAMAAPMLTSCYDDSALNEKLEAVQNEVDQIKTDLTQLKSDLAALKAAVDANLSVSQLNQLPDGYELVFSDGTKAVIKNGTSSVVGAEEDEDGVLYWTLNGEWLLDADGNKIKASAEDGETPQVALTLDEADGYYYWTVNGEWLLDAEGNKVRANGIDGKEPVITMYPSTSEGKWVWNVNGEILKDPNGEVIDAQGPAGDAFFESVKLSEDGTKLIITLLPKKEGEDKVVYEIPMGEFNIMFDDAASAEGVTTDVKKFSYTVSGVSAGDEVIVRVLSTNATGVKVVSESATKGYVELELPSGEGYADIYALNNTTGDLKAKSLKLKGQDFDFEEKVAETLHLSPEKANEVKIPLTTGVEYEFELSDNGADWLTVTNEPRTKAVSYYNLILKADANKSGAHRKTTLTITKKDTENVLAKFTVEQKNYDPSLIYDEDGDIIEWAESFGVSNSSSGTDAVSKKGVFTIALSDDFSKGVYKISNMFMADTYFHEGQTFNNKGGEYYADIEGGILTVHYAGSVLSYGFTKDFEVAYDASNKEFSISESLKTYSYFTRKDVYLVNYKAVVKVDAPSTSSGLDGDWTQTVVFGATSAIKDGAASVVTVTVNGDQVTLENFILTGSTATGTLSGNTITVAAANSGLPSTYGPVDADIVITLSADNRTMSASNVTTGMGYGIAVDSWTADAPAAAPSFDGDWTQTVVFGATSAIKDGAASVVTVTVNGDQVTLENFILTGSTATGTLSGNTITVAAANSGLPSTYGPVDADIVITLSADNRTMSASNVTTGMGYGIAVDSWTATK